MTRFALGTPDEAGTGKPLSKWAAITEYVRRTSREGVAEAEGALRRLEMRVGELLDPAPTPGRPTNQMSVATDITRTARHEFRQMAANPKVVEEPQPLGPCERLGSNSL